MCFKHVAGDPGIDAEDGLVVGGKGAVPRVGRGWPVLVDVDMAASSPRNEVLQGCRPEGLGLQGYRQNTGTEYRGVGATFLAVLGFWQFDRPTGTNKADADPGVPFLGKFLPLFVFHFSLL